MRYENKKIKELCKNSRCYLKIPGICQRTAHDPCHSPDYDRIHGKEGWNVKSHDIFQVPGCRNCHDAIDMNVQIALLKDFPRDEKRRYLQDAFNKAHVAFLLDIIRSGELKSVL